MRKAGGCILHGPTGMEDTRLAMLLNKPDVGTLKNCSWPETQGFWEGASRQFALNFVGQRKKPNPIGPDVLLVTSYFFQSAVSPTETADDLLSQDMINQDKAFSTWKAIFDTVLYSVELKALAMSLRENMTVRIVSTHPNMTRPLVASWTVIVQERVRLLRPAAKPDAPSGLKWQFAFGCELQSLLQCESQALGEAAEGEVSAANNLGLMYSKGLGMGRDYKQALKWFERAAEYSTVAQDHLGTLFLFGRGMEHPDHRKAFQWFRKAAASDYPLAQYHLGVMFRNDGDLQNAIAFFFKAAEKGLPAAESEVASYYAQVRKDDKTALQWYKKAAAGNNVDAQHHLGIMFPRSGTVPFCPLFWSNVHSQTQKIEEGFRVLWISGSIMVVQCTTGMWTRPAGGGSRLQNKVTTSPSSHWAESGKRFWRVVRRTKECMTLQTLS